MMHGQKNINFCFQMLGKLQKKSLSWDVDLRQYVVILSLVNLLFPPATDTGVVNKAQGTGLPCSISSLHAVFKVLGDARF